MLYNNIKKVLDEQGRKNKYLAQKVKISESYLSNIVKGKNIPSVELALKIANAINVPVDQLFSYSEEE